MKQKDLLAIAQEKITETFKKNGVAQATKIKLSEVVTKSKTLIKEALVIIPRAFLLKTEALSMRTKEAHEGLYKKEVEDFNRISIELDTAPKDGGQKFRSLKMDEAYNLNAIKLHELYFSNISDLSSEIRTDSIPYMRLARDWGTFENWQFDFRSACLAAREGWAILYFEPLKNRYMHCVVDGHAIGVPVGCLPIAVIDMWSHSYYRDYLSDKKAYINAMMKELNWNVMEARMVIAERANLQNLYLVQPLVNSEPEKILAQSESQENAPIGKDQVMSKELQYNNPNAPPPMGQQKSNGSSGPSSNGGEY